MKTAKGTYKLMPVYAQTPDLPPIDTLYVVDILELMRNLAARTLDAFATDPWLKTNLTRAFVDCLNLTLVNPHRPSGLPSGFYDRIFKTFATEHHLDPEVFYKTLTEELEAFIKLTIYRYAYWVGGPEKLGIIYKEITAFVIHQHTRVPVIADLRSYAVRQVLDQSTIATT